jgi:hypothetical protein
MAGAGEEKRDITEGLWHRIATPSSSEKSVSALAITLDVFGLVGMRYTE